jgi:putative modified peptide
MMTPHGNDAILGRLATDDAFRAQMLGDPVGTLARLGITVDATAIPAVPSLPSKASLQQDKATIQAAQNQHQAMFPLRLSGKH